MSELCGQDQVVVWVSESDTVTCAYVQFAKQSVTSCALMLMPGRSSANAGGRYC